jgi:hypothetical protein
MNSARFTRSAIDCHPRSGFKVIKELKLQRIHFGLCFTLEMRAKILAAAVLSYNLLKGKSKTSSKNHKDLPCGPAEVTAMVNEEFEDIRD